MMRLRYYGGDGWDAFPENEAFRVKHDTGSKMFTRKSEAKKYYDSLFEEKACWCLSPMELVECHTIVDSNNQ